MRTRNSTMNDVSAACQPIFTVPPLPLELNLGPEAELICTEDGNLFVQLTWTARSLPRQEVNFVQLSLQRHAVDAKPLDLPPFEVASAMVLEEQPPNAFLCCEDYAKLAQEAEFAASARLERLKGSDGSSHAPPWPQAKPGVQTPFACRRCSQFLSLNAPELLTLGPFCRQKIQADSDAFLKAGAMHASEMPAYRDFDDDLRHLRVPESAEMSSKMASAAATGKTLPHDVIGKTAVGTCTCKDVVLRKVLPVDGDKIRYGTTYRFRLRVRDRLLWSPWTELSKPVFVSVPAPRPPQIKLQTEPNVPAVPVPPPILEVQFVGSTYDQDSREVKLRLCWSRFESRMQEVEYRVSMWTLCPEQRRRAQARRQFDTKGRCSLPPIKGTQMIMLDPDFAPPVEVDGSGKHLRTGLEQLPVPYLRPKALASAAANMNMWSPSSTGDSPLVQHGPDAPQIIAHLQPFEPPPRENIARRGPKAATKNPTVGGSQPVAATVDGDLSPRANKLHVDVGVSAASKGHGYVFGVEAKHGRGVCGGTGEWSVPLYSKLVEFEVVPKVLQIDYAAQYGALVWKGAVTAPATRPTDEQLTVEAPSVSHAQNHHELPYAKGLLPREDAWPLRCTPSKYITRAKGGGTVIAEVAADPEPAPLNDEIRET
eukprot:gnl/TRDRNA2_/TRDRNA2_178003_c2_seq1.p1 gnl/TRDRNA2_/TRDRNA2_178003_c2~~gnl/TRDRNA2_/TRDRNA2_178003_c2_seq1.p1  ORF type:complete len:652 (-),score=120.16 gnl/TRDRNA2_/TRDRNA2_178003_c2_seq1:34-1989(-)